MPRRLPLGSRVALRAGGPVMLVVDYERDLLVCAWRGAKGVQEANYPTDHLWRLTDA